MARTSGWAFWGACVTSLLAAFLWLAVAFASSDSMFGDAGPVVRIVGALLATYSAVMYWVTVVTLRRNRPSS
jgi:hypothetical protein